MTEILQTPPRKWFEIGSSIFSVFNIISAVIAIVLSCSLFVVLLSYLNGSEGKGDPDLSIILVILLSLVMTLSLIRFAFSIILVKGVFQRKPSFVKAYFVYGVVMIAISIVASVALASIIPSENLKYILVPLGVYVVYSAILAMIWATYGKLQRESQYTHSTLDDIEFVGQKQNMIDNRDLTTSNENT